VQVSALTTSFTGGRAASPRKELDLDCPGSRGTQIVRQSVLKNLPFEAYLRGKLESIDPTGLQILHERRGRRVVTNLQITTSLPRSVDPVYLFHIPCDVRVKL